MASQRKGKVHESAETVLLNIVLKCKHKRSKLFANHERLKAAVGNLFMGEYREEEPWKQRTAAGWTIGVKVLKAGT